MKAVFFLGPLSYGNEEITVFTSSRTLDTENVPLIGVLKLVEGALKANARLNGEQPA